MTTSGANCTIASQGGAVTYDDGVLPPLHESYISKNEHHEIYDYAEIANELHIEIDNDDSIVDFMDYFQSEYWWEYA